MKNMNVTKSDTFSNKVQVDLHMLSPLMLNWVAGEVDGADVVVVDYRGTPKRTVKFL